jgi:hypothetical protein
MSRHAGGPVRRWSCEQRISAPRGANAASLGSNRLGLSATGPCKVVGPAMFVLLDGNSYIYMALPPRMGARLKRALFASGNSDDGSDRRCLSVRNRHQYSLEDPGESIGGGGDGCPICRASVVGLSDQPDTVYRHQVTGTRRIAPGRYRSRYFSADRPVTPGRYRSRY